VVSGYEFKWAKYAALPKIEKIYKEDLAGQDNLQVISKDNFNPFFEV